VVNRQFSSCYPHTSLWNHDQIPMICSTNGADASASPSTQRSGT
jgi:hypothetical protein